VTDSRCRSGCAGTYTRPSFTAATTLRGPGLVSTIPAADFATSVALETAIPSAPGAAQAHHWRHRRTCRRCVRSSESLQSDTCLGRTPANTANSLGEHSPGLARGQTAPRAHFLRNDRRRGRASPSHHHADAQSMQLLMKLGRIRGAVGSLQAQMISWQPHCRVFLRTADPKTLTSSSSPSQPRRVGSSI